MPPIEGNFNKELELLWGGKGVAARGPLKWGEEEPGERVDLAALAKGKNGNQ